MTDYKWKRSAIDNLQARAKWIDNYQLACKDRDHLVSICNQKEVELKCLRWQVEKAIRVIEEFLDRCETTANCQYGKVCRAVGRICHKRKSRIETMGG